MKKTGYKKPTIRELVDVFKAGMRNHETGPKYCNPHPCGSFQWMAFERGFRRAFKESGKNLPLMSVMMIGLNLIKLENDKPGLVKRAFCNV